MNRRVWLAAVAAVMVTVAVGARQDDRLTTDLLKGIELRSIGPTLATGRIADIEIDPKNTSIWYVATAFGGLWKTTNRGITWESIFDDYTFTLCCVVVDPKDSNVIWLGTGENTSQRSAHFGDGLYKSTDAGKTWKRVGLENSEHIGKILVDPRNSNVVYVASQGPLFSSGGDRGLYKTTDGGATWTAILTISPDTGISDIVFDPRNADVIYASAYQRRRAVGQMIGGGPEGGIYKTTNAGKNWTKLTKGLPTGDMGRAGLARRRTQESRDGVRARRCQACGVRVLPIGRCGRDLDAGGADGQHGWTRRRTGRRAGGYATDTVCAAGEDDGNLAAGT